MKCTKCNAELQTSSTFCPNCGEKVEAVTTTNTTTKTSGGSIGWGFLGFFVPIVGLILFIVWLKKNKKSAMAAGIGALIGFVVEIIVSLLILVFAGGLFNLGPLETNTYDITIKKTSDIEENGYYGNALKSKYYTYMYTADLDPDEAKSDFYNDVNYNIYDKNGTKLFRLEWDKIGAGIKKDCKYVMNNGEEFYDDECILYTYEFGYYNNLMVFGDAKTMRNNFYVYDLNNSKLTKIFSKDDNPNFEVIDYNIDNRDSLVFTTFYSQYNDEANLGYRKEMVIRDVESDVMDTAITNATELENRLAAEGLDNFTVERVLTFTKGNDGYVQTDVKEKTIKEYFNEIKYGKEEPTEIPAITARTKDCVGTAKTDTNKYTYSISEGDEYKDCKTVTFKLNDDFTLRYDIELDGDGSYSSYDLYVNDEKVDGGVYGFNNEVFINGKTLVMREFSTDAGAEVFLINTQGIKYNSSLAIDNLVKKSVKVNDSGDLIISGTSHSNIYGDKVGNNYVSNPCAQSFDDLKQVYGINDDTGYDIDFTFKMGSDGKYNTTYSSKETTRTWKEYYNSACNR